MKFLPFGYGPAGSHFVVEDMAAVSEDEEVDSFACVFFSV
jgi:hypothetical protein